MSIQKQVEDIYPLSPMQQGILYHVLLNDHAGLYVPQVVLSLTGLTDVAAFRAAWQRAVDRNSVLRTGFQWEQREQPFQVVYRQVALCWQQQDWRLLPADQRNLEQFLEQDRRQKFNLKAAPLMRLTLIQTDDTDYELVWTQQHLILDGWSAGLVLQQVFADYHQQAISPSRPYRDYIAWLQLQDRSAAQAFWQAQLQGFTTATQLPRTRQAGHHSGWGEQMLTLQPATTATLKSLAQQHHFTLNILIQAAFGLLLSRYSNETDLLFGATVAGRPAALLGSESMVGLFINSLPVRLKIPAQADLISWLQQLQIQQAEAMQYDYSPLFDIQDWSEIPRGTPLFDSLLVFENYPIDPALLQHRSGLQLTQVQSVEWTSLPLTLVVSASDQLTFRLKFERQRFDLDIVTRLLRHLQTLLTSIAANPSQPIADLPLLSQAEQQQIHRWNQTQTDCPQICLHQLLEAQFRLVPDAVAVVFEQQYLTYAQLNSRANQLARYLQSSGVQPEAPVGIYLDRSLDLAIAILAVLKAGATYVPLDPSYPVERLKFMLSDAQIQQVLSHSSLDPAIASDAQAPVEMIALDCLWGEISNWPSSNLDLPVLLDQSAYILYTSGSTGRPKGVINSHRGLVNRLIWMQQEYHLTPADRVLQKTPCGFDVSVWEFFWPWLAGATLVIAKPDAHRDSAELAQVIELQQITTLHFVPSMLQAFLEVSDLTGCAAIQQIICSGEALPTDLANRCLSRLNASLHNLYGPTEAAIDVSYFRVTPEVQTLPSVPIGRPISNLQLYILDCHHNAVPVGATGELYIAGIGLARGYLNRPELTAEAFIPNPFLNPDQPNRLQLSRLYKTGDLACYLPNGAIQFLGRSDSQVKLRGLRIELDEIAALLNRHAAVQQAVVALSSEPHPHLVAYLVSAPAEPPVPQPELLQFLRPHLPDFMLPTRFLWLDCLPLTPNGKLDRRALPLPDAPMRQILPPRNPIEAIIAAIWAEVLQLESISIDDSFFDLGGNSLIATRINSRLRQAFQLDIPLRSLLERPTVAALAERIDVMQQTLKQIESPADPSADPSANQAGRKEIEL